MEYKKEKIGCYEKYTNECYEELRIGQEGEDFIRNQLAVRLDNYIFTHMVGKYEHTKYFDRPTFLDWLLRRRRTINIKVDIKEMLPYPPKGDNIIFAPDFDNKE